MAPTFNFEGKYTLDRLPFDYELSFVTLRKTKKIMHLKLDTGFHGRPNVGDQPPATGAPVPARTLPLECDILTFTLCYGHCIW